MHLTVTEIVNRLDEFIVAFESEDDGLRCFRDYLVDLGSVVPPEEPVVAAPALW